MSSSCTYCPQNVKCICKALCDDCRKIYECLQRDERKRRIKEEKSSKTNTNQSEAEEEAPQENLIEDKEENYRIYCYRNMRKQHYQCCLQCQAI
jgi:predicted Holliday junction resolvase-like endonuclease